MEQTENLRKYVEYSKNIESKSMSYGACFYFASKRRLLNTISKNENSKITDGKP